MANKTVTTKASWRPVVRTAMVLSALLALSGCGGFDGIELKGKMFDAVGLNDTAVKKTPKMAPRSGLVTPPSLERLPEPGATQAPAGGLASINDPDLKRVENAENLARRQAAYCKKHYEPGKARGDDSVDSVEGPAGPCRASVFTAIKKLTGSGDDQDQN